LGIVLFLYVLDVLWAETLVPFFGVGKLNIQALNFAIVEFYRPWSPSKSFCEGICGGGGDAPGSPKMVLGFFVKSARETVHMHKCQVILRGQDKSKPFKISIIPYYFVVPGPKTGIPLNLSTNRRTQQNKNEKPKRNLGGRTVLT
jgi:hypothetical protein